jgi:hypothetical protein
MVKRIGFRNVAAFFANDHGQLAFPVERTRDLGTNDGLAMRDQ